MNDPHRVFDKGGAFLEVLHALLYLRDKLPCVLTFKQPQPLEDFVVSVVPLCRQWGINVYSGL